MPVNIENVALIERAMGGREVSGDFYPSVYVLEPSSRCNLKCVMCPNPMMTPSNWGDIDLELLDKILTDISPYAEFLMLYWMGESLLHPNIEQILKRAKSKISGKIVLSSNMTVLSAPAQSAILDHVDMLICSLDRWNKDTYEKIRRGSDFDSVVSNIENLLAEKQQRGSNCEIIVKALDIKQQDSEYQDFVTYWTTRGARPMLAWLNDWAGTFNDMRNAASLDIPRASIERGPCSDLWFKMVINWRGDVQMCCFDWNYQHKISEYKDGNWLKNAWQGAAIKTLRKAHLDGQYDVNKLCSECDTWGDESEHNAYVNWSEESYFKLF